jgi:hypothetical protein
MKPYESEKLDAIKRIDDSFLFIYEHNVVTDSNTMTQSSNRHVATPAQFLQRQCIMLVGNTWYSTSITYTSCRTVTPHRRFRV